MTLSKDPGLGTDPGRGALRVRGRAQVRAIRQRTKVFECYERTQKARQAGKGRQRLRFRHRRLMDEPSKRIRGAGTALGIT